MGRLLDNPKCKIGIFLKNDVHFPGNVVEGILHLEVTQPLDLIALRLKLCGKEKTAVAEIQGSGKAKQTERHYSTMVIDKQLLTVIGHLQVSRCRDTISLPRGKFTYPFRFQLPLNVPPSYHKRGNEGEMATILYYVKAYIDTEAGHEAKKKRFFRVLAAMPSRQWVDRRPVRQDREAAAKCCWFGKGVVRLSYFLDRSVIAIDRDSLIVFVDVDNSHSKVPVESVDASLVHHLEYSAGESRQHVRHVSGHNFLKYGVPAGDKGRLQVMITLNRSLAPTNVCFNVKSTYTVEVHLNIPHAGTVAQSLDVTIVHTVDDTNTLPPIDSERCQFRVLRKKEMPENFYGVPPRPVFDLMAANLAPPPYAPTPVYEPVAFPFIPPQPRWAEQRSNFSEVHWYEGEPTAIINPPNMLVPPPPLVPAGTPLPPQQREVEPPPRPAVPDMEASAVRAPSPQHLKAHDPYGHSSSNHSGHNPYGRSHSNDGDAAAGNDTFRPSSAGRRRRNDPFDGSPLQGRDGFDRTAKGLSNTRMPTSGAGPALLDDDDDASESRTHSEMLPTVAGADRTIKVAESTKRPTDPRRAPPTDPASSPPPNQSTEHRGGSDSAVLPVMGDTSVDRKLLSSTDISAAVQFACGSPREGGQGSERSAGASPARLGDATSGDYASPQVHLTAKDIAANQASGELSSPAQGTNHGQSGGSRMHDDSHAGASGDPSSPLHHHG